MYMSDVRLAHYGIVGLGVMGRNLAWNLHSQNIPVVTYSIDAVERAEVRAVTADLQIEASLPALINQLDSPRTVLLMITAGEAIDQVLTELLPLLEPGDAVLDGGNSFYKDTERRIEMCQGTGIEYLGVGVSGGESGARHGASIMVGGNQQSYNQRVELFAALACMAEGEPCYGHVGEGGAGHFVKMVHNGIEYAVMQLLAESYDFMHRGLKLEASEIHAWFASQQGGQLDSYLLDITVGILAKRDDLDTGLLLDKVADQAGQKGTGQWSSVAALEYGVPAPGIIAAVTERQISALVDQRLAFADALEGIEPLRLDSWRQDLADTLFAGMLVAFSQGLELIRQASDVHDWGSDILAPVRLWRGGCIIRAALLNNILANGESLRAGLPLLLAPEIKARVARCTPGWRRIVSTGVIGGLPMPSISACLSYFDSLRSTRLPTALIQAQRDCFGAHTFARVDRPGRFHADWLGSEA